MRLFVAIDFNSLKDYFIEVLELLPSDLSFVNSFHLTLKFLGEVDESKIDEIVFNLKKIKFEHFSVFLDSIGFFESHGNVNVVWIDLKPQNEIVELQRKIDESLSSLFLKMEASSAWPDSCLLLGSEKDWGNLMIAT